MKKTGGVNFPPYNEMNRCKRNGRPQAGPRFLSHSGWALGSPEICTVREGYLGAHWDTVGMCACTFFFACFCIVRSEVHRRRDIIGIYSFSSASLGY